MYRYTVCYYSYIIIHHTYVQHVLHTENTLFSIDGSGVLMNMGGKTPRLSLNKHQHSIMHGGDQYNGPDLMCWCRAQEVPARLCQLHLSHVLSGVRFK